MHTYTHTHTHPTMQYLSGINSFTHLPLSARAQVDPGSSASEQCVSEALAVLCTSGLGRHLGSWLLNTLQTRLATTVAPEFWAGLEQPENELEERDRARVLLVAFHTLLEKLEPFIGKCCLTQLSLSTVLAPIGSLTRLFRFTHFLPV